MRSYIILCEAGDRSCHYWISTASLSPHMTQSAANASGQRDEGKGKRGKRDARGKGRVKGLEEKRWKERDKAGEADDRVKEEREPKQFCKRTRG